MIRTTPFGANQHTQQEVLAPASRILGTPGPTIIIHSKLTS